MTDLIDSILKLNSMWIYGTALFVLIVLASLIYWYILTRIFKERLRKIIITTEHSQLDEAIKHFAKYYPPEKLAHYSKRMERYSRQWGPKVIQETGLDEKWIQKLNHSPTKSDLRRVLLYCPKKYLFKAFLAAGQHSGLRKPFFKWMKNEGDEKVIRLLAESCRGEDFNPAFCISFMENNGALLRDLTGEAEWYTRYFAYKILFLDEKALAERNLDDGIVDPHPLNRKIIIEKFYAESEKTWAVLWNTLIHDPVYEVREAARKRITKDFSERYKLRDENLNAEETARVLELLDPNCQEDRTFALDTLESNDKFLRYPAAVFLQKCGILSSLLSKNTLDDQGNITNSIKLLHKALEVNVSNFLLDYPTGDGGPLFVAACLLTEQGGTKENICYLEEKVFNYFSSLKLGQSNKPIYIKTLEAVTAKGNIKAYEIFAQELSRRESDQVFLEILLLKIPNNAASIFLPILFNLLKNPVFPIRKELEQTIGTFNPDLILPFVFGILNANRAENPHIVRISALRILGQLRLPFCLQRILESLPTLCPDEIEEFSALIASYPQELFEEKAKTLFTMPDSKIRASLITILPATKNTGFLKEIRAALKDVDPDVRVAAIKALLGFGEIRLLNQETSMLRDPIERVRLATAEVITQHGNAVALDILKNIISDPNETDVVKIGVINGLGMAASADSITILVSVLESQSELAAEAEKSLVNRTSKRDINQLIEIFKDAEPQLREKLIPVFRRQGAKTEPYILEILKDEVASLRPFLIKILEETGYIDKAKRRLSNRNVETRREAAQMLSLLDTLPAFRGLVLAAKDPDQEVRVCVVRALEKLNNSQSRDILENLKNDPDTRIRKYTHWAFERLDSLAQE
ncbi:MAG: HEAT repeat domain-containing protein [Treponema sp.]|jgi:HEAT repeat protein|nr:HEAT repeat domain-containing protein [Treponema sp.]